MSALRKVRISKGMKVFLYGLGSLIVLPVLLFGALLLFQSIEWKILKWRAHHLWVGQQVEMAETELDGWGFTSYAIEKTGPNRRLAFKGYSFLEWREVLVELEVKEGIVTRSKTGMRF